MKFLFRFKFEFESFVNISDGVFMIFAFAFENSAIYFTKRIRENENKEMRLSEMVNMFICLRF